MHITKSTRILLTIVVICSVFITPSYSSDFNGNCFSSLTWEEHVFIREDESFIITIISFFVINDTSNLNSDSLHLDAVVLSRNVDKVLLYPDTHAYEDIESISLLESSHPTEIMPQNVSIIRVNFLDTIRHYGRYSFAILTTIDGFIHTERLPLNLGRTTHTLDYSIWFHSYESNIDSVPIGLHSKISQIMEGVRSAQEFPRLTISYDKGLAIESKSPNPDTEFDGLPYTFGICQEKRDGEATVIETGLLPGILVSHNATLAKGETMSLSFYRIPFFPDEMVKTVIGTSLDNSDEYHTVGWFHPPPHVFLSIYYEGIPPTTVFTIIVTILFTIIGVPSVWKIYEKRKGKKKRTKKSACARAHKYFKKLRAYLAGHLGKLVSLCVIALGSSLAIFYYVRTHSLITAIQYLIGFWPAGLSFYVILKAPSSSRRAKSKIAILRPAIVGFVSYVVSFFAIWRVRYTYQPPVDLYDEVFFIVRIILSSLALSFFLAGLVAKLGKVRSELYFIVSGLLGVLTGVIDTTGILGFDPPPPPLEWFVSMFIGLILGSLIVLITLTANIHTQQID